jgi:2-(1,2-epoxy-1,2-dihydrophenyl)acetyl-CoA isomerase
MTGAYDHLRYSAAGGVATVTLNRPQAMNAFTRALGIELLAAVRAAAADERTRVVVLTGEGRAFSAGADVKDPRPLTPEGQPDLGAGLTQVYNPLILEVRRMPKPVIAAVNGPAVGFACSLAAACDLVLAAQSAYFMLAFARIGLVPDGGASLTIPARIGLGRATRLAMLGERLPAAEALAWGLVDETVPDEQLPVRTARLAAALAAGPSAAYAEIKELFNRSCLPGLEGQLGAEAMAQFRRGTSAEYAEGVLAFREKRAADFSRAG